MLACQGMSIAACSMSELNGSDFPSCFEYSVQADCIVAHGLKLEAAIVALGIVVVLPGRFVTLERAAPCAEQHRVVVWYLSPCTRHPKPETGKVTNPQALRPFSSPDSQKKRSSERRWGAGGPVPRRCRIQPKPLRNLDSSRRPVQSESPNGRTGV